MEINMETLSKFNEFAQKIRAIQNWKAALIKERNSIREASLIMNLTLEETLQITNDPEKFKLLKAK